MCKCYVHVKQLTAKPHYKFEDSWTVGFYNPENEFVSESSHFSQEEAAQRVHYLNGGN